MCKYFVFGCNLGFLLRSLKMGRNFLFGCVLVFLFVPAIRYAGVIKFFCSDHCKRVGTIVFGCNSDCFIFVFHAKSGTTNNHRTGFIILKPLES